MVLENANLGLCSYWLWIAGESYPKQDLVTPIDGSEVYKLRRLVQKSELMLRRRRIEETDGQCEDLEEELADPTYVLATHSSASEIEEEKEEEAGKHGNEKEVEPRTHQLKLQRSLRSIPMMKS